ncbi:hypothetical protein A5662_14870 [Mycobacteriaceae bacterium 1482268.1]|nr:hypothetical protein A5662_14870 [Mycobacteriaceae bacterium 1482268.1]
MIVDVPGLIAAAQKLLGLATSAQGLLAETVPLAADPTSASAAARLDAASLQLWGAACAQAAALHTAAAHLIMIAAKFGGQEEINAAGLTMLVVPSMATDDATLATLAPVPPIPSDVRAPLAPGTPLTGEGFARLVHNGSAANGVGFSNTATNNGIAIDTAAITVREVAAMVPEMWDSPVGTAALAGRLNEHVTALNTIADRWFELADQARKHADDYSQTVSATPKPQEFQDKIDAFNRANAAGNQIAASQALQERGVLEGRAQAEAARYAGITETTTSPQGAGNPQAPGAGVPGGGAAPAGAGAAGTPSAAPGQAQLAKAGAAEAAQAGQAGEGAGQLAQMLPAALGAIGGLAGGMAGMAGQVPQGLMQAGQGLAQAATQGMSGLASKTAATDADLGEKLGDYKPADLEKAKGGGGAGGGGAGDTHPAGALGPPVTPSTSHTPPAMPSGAAPPPAGPTPAGGTAMGGMPMGGMMPHGQGGGDAGEKVPADKKIVTPPQPHTEAVTGRVSDRTAAAAEASRARADKETDDDQPPRGPVLRRITLAPLNDERS